MHAPVLSSSRVCLRSHCPSLLLTHAQSWRRSTSHISLRSRRGARKAVNSNSRGRALPKASQHEQGSAGVALGSDAQQQQQQRRRAARSAFVVAWIGSVPAVYLLLQSVDLPKVSPLLLQLLPGLAATGASAPLLLKVLLRDRFQVEWHRGRLYFQLLTVPPTGPPVPEGSIEVRPTGDGKGNGAFAVQPLSKGQYVCYYEGDLINTQEYYQRYPTGTSDHVMRVDDEYAVDASALVPDTSRFSAVHMNHSRRPNVGRYYKRSEHRVEFYTLRDIMPGEELVYNYGKDYWSGREDVEL